MKLSGSEFQQWPHKAITLLGMSGVGKTRLARMLREKEWFHYSGDYRIGTRYLDEAILDNIKLQIMHIPFMRDLLLTDSIHINNNITVDNLRPVSSFLGKLGSPDAGGHGLKEFKRRQSLHHDAEIAAMKDVPDFIEKSRKIYGYDHFINDAGGSLCELDDPEVFKTLAEHTVIIYLKATEKDEKALIQRAEKDPKPLYYRESFLDDELSEFMHMKGIDYASLIEPDEFVRWVFPRLFYSRLPRYQKIADEFGYSISTEQLSDVSNGDDFIQLIISTLNEQQ